MKPDSEIVEEEIIALKVRVRELLDAKNVTDEYDLLRRRAQVDDEINDAFNRVSLHLSAEDGDWRDFAEAFDIRDYCYEQTWRQGLVTSLAAKARELDEGGRRMTLGDLLDAMAGTRTKVDHIRTEAARFWVDGDVDAEALARDPNAARDLSAAVECLRTELDREGALAELVGQFKDIHEEYMIACNEVMWLVRVAEKS